MDGNSEFSLWPFAVFIQNIPTSTKKERHHIVLGLFVYAGPVNPIAVTESVFAQLLLLCQKQAPVECKALVLPPACCLHLLMLSCKCHPSRSRATSPYIVEQAAMFLIFKIIAFLVLVVDFAAFPPNAALRR
jgi:hypothetical protein